MDFDFTWWIWGERGIALSRRLDRRVSSRSEGRWGFVMTGLPVAWLLRLMQPTSCELGLAGFVG